VDGSIDAGDGDDGQDGPEDLLLHTAHMRGTAQTREDMNTQQMQTSLGYNKMIDRGQ
jgi:hypothetical protein